MAAPSVTGYQSIINSGVFCDVIQNHSGFLQDFNTLANYHRAQCSINRTFASGTYYFHNTVGDDVAGDGSIASPYQTLTKASGIAASLGGHFKLLFARNSVWVDPTGLNISDRYNVAVGDYGSTTGRIPLFTAFRDVGAFTNKLGSPVSGVEKIDLTNTPFSGNIIEWVAEGNNYEPSFLANPYIEYAGSGTLHQAPSGGYYWASGINLLYVKPLVPLTASSVIRATNAKQAGLVIEDRPNTSGSTTIGNVTAHNIRCDGYGFRRTDPSVYGIRLGGPNTQVWASGLEQYYSAYHNIVCVANGGATTMPTRWLIEGCNAGYSKPNGAAAIITTYAMYNALGNLEVLYHQNNCLGGGLATKEIASTGAYGTSYYAHSDGGAGHNNALCIGLNNRNIASGNRPATVPTQFGNTMVLNGRHNVTGYKSIIVGDINDRFVDRGEFPALNNTIYMRGTYGHDLRNQVVFPNHNMIATGIYGGVIFHDNIMRMRIDLNGFTAGFSAMFSQASHNGDRNYDHAATFDYNNIHIDRAANQAFTYGDLVGTGNAAYHGGQLIFTNNILTTLASGVSVWINVPNRIPTYGNGANISGGLFRNAGYSMDTTDYAPNGFPAMVNGVAPCFNIQMGVSDLVATGTRPKLGNAVYRAGSGGLDSTFTPTVDYYGLPRTSLFSIGAFEDAAVPLTQVNGSGIWNSGRTTNTVAWSDPTPFGVSGYIIEKNISGSGTTSGFYPFASGQLYVDNFGTPDFYSYRITPVNENGEAGQTSAYFNVSVPITEGIQKAHAGIINDGRHVKQAVIKGYDTTRNVPGNNFTGDISKLDDRNPTSSGRTIYGIPLNTNNVLDTHTIITSSGDLGKTAKRATFRNGFRNIQKNN